MAIAGNAGAVALSSGRAEPIKTNKIDNARPANGPAMAVSNKADLDGAYSLSSLEAPNEPVDNEGRNTGKDQSTLPLRARTACAHSCTARIAKIPMAMGSTQAKALSSPSFNRSKSCSLPAPAAAEKAAALPAVPTKPAKRVARPNLLSICSGRVSDATAMITVGLRAAAINSLGGASGLPSEMSLSSSARSLASCNLASTSSSVGGTGSSNANNR
mmetsp:Transcript_8770/g.25026  ORF Transcript_8770/g.25026 Transcript_8770/m.25026 type:complete len:216 (-) Transcript_8770:1057-1704(-)